MKTIEEKAKAYDEAIQRMKGYVIDEFGCTRLKPSDIFPELAESEDEKIRKALVKLVKKASEGYENVEDGVSVQDAIAWLEKQGEKKTPKFRVGDVVRNKKTGRQFYVHHISKEGYLSLSDMNQKVFQGYLSEMDYENFELVEQKPVDWSEEDEERYESCIKMLGTGNPEQPETVNTKWFREHVSPQKQWKPTEEQMDALGEAINNVPTLRGVLEELLEQLKAL